MILCIVPFYISYVLYFFSLYNNHILTVQARTEQNYRTGSLFKFNAETRLCNKREAQSGQLFRMFEEKKFVVAMTYVYCL